MLEYEKKIMLTQDEFKVLLEQMGKGAKTVIQTNRYFDTDDYFMSKNNITCRIRDKEGVYVSTIKAHSINGCSMEKDLHVTDDPNCNVFQRFGAKFKGELKTKRTVIHKDQNCEIVLDANSYLGYEDYELEVEYSERYEEQAIKLIGKVANILVLSDFICDSSELIARIGKGASKSERFFNRLINSDVRCQN